MGTGMKEKWWAKGFALACLLVLFGAPAVAGAQGAGLSGDGGDAGEILEAFPESARTDAYREAVLRVAERYHLPGAAVGVWVPDREPWKLAYGYADLEAREPMRLNHRLPIRSVTKSFTVTLLLKAVRKGLVSLEDPIGGYVAGVPNGDRITLAHLAAMESGLKSYEKVEAFMEALGEDPARYWTPESLLDLSFSEPPLFEPGERYDYSNTNCVLLGMVLERVTGKPLAELYRRWLFRPLGMKRTSYPDSAVLPDPHAAPYLVDPATGEAEEFPVVNLSAFGASGGMVTTLGDLHLWGEALGKGTLVGKRLQETRLQHSRPVTSGPEYDRYGLGIGELKGWWGHTGEGLGYQAATFYDPRTGAVVAVMLNSSQTPNVAAEIFKALADIVHPPAEE